MGGKHFAKDIPRHCKGKQNAYCSKRVQLTRCTVVIGIPANESPLLGPEGALSHGEDVGDDAVDGVHHVGVLPLPRTLHARRARPGVGHRDRGVVFRVRLAKFCSKKREREKKEEKKKK